MIKVLLSLFILTTFAQASSGLEGKSVALTFDVNGLVQTNATLTANSVFQGAELSSGLFFEPLNKLMKIEIPTNCKSLAEIAFTQNLKLTVAGEIKKHDEFFARPSFIQFAENGDVSCKLLK